jgi:hypothetical protein
MVSPQLPCVEEGTVNELWLAGSFVRVYQAPAREDELKILRRFDEFYEGTSVKSPKRLESGILQRSLSKLEIKTISSITTPLDPDTEDEESDTDELPRQVEIIRERATPLPSERHRDEQMSINNYMIFQSGLAQIPGIAVRASVACGKAVWLVRTRGIIDVARIGHSQYVEGLSQRLEGRAYERGE